MINKQKRKELVQKFIAKLKKEIEEERKYQNELLQFCDFIPKNTTMFNLIKLDAVEHWFCNETFYDCIYDNGHYIIGDELLTLLCIRELNTARDLMESAGLASRFTNPREFEFNLLSVFELGLLRDELKKEKQNDTRK